MASCLLSELKLDVAFGIYVIGALTVDVALLYCRMNGASDLAVYRQRLEERYLEEDVEEIRKVHDAVGKWRKLRKPIKQWLVEYSLHKWTDGVNNTAGVAHTFESVLERYRILRQEKHAKGKV